MRQPKASHWDIEAFGSPVLHGYAPPSPEPLSRFTPPLTITISRQTGCRGRAIAERAAELLGWQLMHQETLEFGAKDSDSVASLEGFLSLDAREWIDARMAVLNGESPFAENAELKAFARVVLQIAAQGSHVILGYGAGWVIPTEANLGVRIVAPRASRVAYIAETQRLSWTEAELHVREQDEARGRFFAKRFGRSVNGLSQYDLVLNASSMGIEACAQTIVAAAEAKRQPTSGAPANSRGEGAG